MFLSGRRLFSFDTEDINRISTWFETAKVFKTILNIEAYSVLFTWVGEYLLDRSFWLSIQ